MSLHDQLVRIFVVYLFVKAMIFLPLTWVALCLWWQERKQPKATGGLVPVVTIEETSHWYDHLLGSQPETPQPRLADILA